MKVLAAGTWPERQTQEIGLGTALFTAVVPSPDVHSLSSPFMIFLLQFFSSQLVGSANSPLISDLRAFFYYSS